MSVCDDSQVWGRKQRCRTTDAASCAPASQLVSCSGNISWLSHKMDMIDYNLAYQVVAKRPRERGIEVELGMRVLQRFRYTFST